jgi:hypothetical protein
LPECLSFNQKKLSQKFKMAPIFMMEILWKAYFSGSSHTRQKFENAEIFAYSWRTNSKKTKKICCQKTKFKIIPHCHAVRQSKHMYFKNMILYEKTQMSFIFHIKYIQSVFFILACRCSLSNYFFNCSIASSDASVLHHYHVIIFLLLFKI